MFNYLKYIPLVFLTIYVGFIKSEEAFKAGIHYEILDSPTPTSDINKIEVVELFWLSCSHCYSLEFYINDWKKKTSSKYPVCEVVIINTFAEKSYKKYSR